jgi:hypothetical protein
VGSVSALGFEEIDQLLNVTWSSFYGKSRKAS